MVEGGPDGIQEALAATERWFVRQGVPHFVAGSPVSTRVPIRLQPIRGVIVLVRLGLSILTWTVRRIGREVRDIGRLAGRGVPTLVLFGVLTFFSSDFWRIAAALGSDSLWLVAGFFLILTYVFLLTRLPEELGRLESHLTPAQIRASCAGTPVEPLLTERQPAEPVLAGGDPRIGPAQRVNMLVYLLLCQQIQVALLSWIVFAFFVVFGAVAVQPAVITDWFGHPPHDPARVLGVPWPGISSELLHSSLLLAALSAFYFTISAVTDDRYREEFFTRTIAELRRAVVVRGVYLQVRESEPPPR